jgi:hypothetical protein
MDPKRGRYRLGKGGGGINIQSMELDYPHSFLRPVESKWGGVSPPLSPPPHWFLGENAAIITSANRIYTRINSLRMRSSRAV